MCSFCPSDHGSLWIRDGVYIHRFLQQLRLRFFEFSFNVPFHINSTTSGSRMLNRHYVLENSKVQFVVLSSVSVEDRKSSLKDITTDHEFMSNFSVYCLRQYL